MVQVQRWRLEEGKIMKDRLKKSMSALSKNRKSDKRDQVLSAEYGVMSPGTKGRSEKSRNKIYKKKMDQRDRKALMAEEKSKARRGDLEAAAALRRMKAGKKK
jgi:hypothetical protein